ncbi:MAG: hypothetical protein ACRCU6_04275 [Fusobacteriaceae bacterium]
MNLLEKTRLLTSLKAERFEAEEQVIFTNDKLKLAEDEDQFKKLSEDLDKLKNRVRFLTNREKLLREDLAESRDIYNLLAHERKVYYELQHKHEEKIKELKDKFMVDLENLMEEANKELGELKAEFTSPEIREVYRVEFNKYITSDTLMLLYKDDIIRKLF